MPCLNIRFISILISSNLKSQFQFLETMMAFNGLNTKTSLISKRKSQIMFFFHSFSKSKHLVEMLKSFFVTNEKSIKMFLMKQSLKKKPIHTYKQVENLHCHFFRKHHSFSWKVSLSKVYLNANAVTKILPIKTKLKKANFMVFGYLLVFKGNRTLLLMYERAVGRSENLGGNQY